MNRIFIEMPIAPTKLHCFHYKFLYLLIPFFLSYYHSNIFVIACDVSAPIIIFNTTSLVPNPVISVNVLLYYNS